jgi:hypothetical protein
MQNWMKQLGLTFGLVFAVGAPSTALAYPPQCMDVCSCASSCTRSCYWGTYPTNCGAEEVCVGSAFCGGLLDTLDTQASVSQEAQEAQQQADEDVCAEQAEQTVSAES